MDAIIFLSGTDNRPPICDHLKIGRPQDLEAEKNRHPLPAVFLVVSGQMEMLRGFTDVIVDRGVKHKNKGLADYLTGFGNEKIPVIDGNYTSVRALLNQAAGKQEKTLFIIGVDPRIFRRIWRQNAGKASKTRSRLDAVLTDAVPDPEIIGLNSWLRNELGQNCEVPAQLYRRYLGKSEEAGVVRLLVMLAARNLDPVLILGATGPGRGGRRM